VFEAVIHWTGHNNTTRLEHIAQLMEHVRLPLLPQEILVQRVEEEPLIKNSTACKDFLIEAMKFHLLKPEQKILYKTPRTRARTPIGLPKVFISSAFVFCAEICSLLRFCW
jgi:kelch-like protein 2/3